MSQSLASPVLKDTRVPANVTQFVISLNLVVASRYQISVDKLISRLRDTDTAQARFVCWYILRSKLGLTYFKIASHYQRDRVAIQHGIEVVKAGPLRAIAEEIWKSDLSTYPQS